LAVVVERTERGSCSWVDLSLAHILLLRPSNLWRRAPNTNHEVDIDEDGGPSFGVYRNFPSLRPSSSLDTADSFSNSTSYEGLSRVLLYSQSLSRTAITVLSSTSGVL
jgi:hypothetical protein